MPNTKPKTTGFLKCQHCGNYAPMDIVVEYFLSAKPQSSSSYDDPYDNDNDYEPEYGYYYNLLLCRACKKVTLRRYFEHDWMDPAEVEIQTLYPPVGLEVSKFPSVIQNAYEAALKARAIDANAYAILLGRMLEVVCEDRQVKGDNLYEKLRVLADKGEIPANLVGVAHGLRMLRNIGVHEPLEGLTNEEIPILDDLSKAILEYIYIAPQLADKAEKRLNSLKEKKRRKDMI
jgi:Domain of unknown function (DUF4145)